VVARSSMDAEADRSIYNVRLNYIIMLVAYAFYGVKNSFSFSSSHMI
jgi:hypothetical protein